MTRARDIANLVDANGDIVAGALDNVPASNDASALTTGTLPVDRVPYFTNRNAIINGSFEISQRGLETANNLTGSGVFTTDRFFGQAGGTGLTVSAERDTDVPTNTTLNYSTKFSVTAAATGTDHYTRTTTRIEGYDIARLGLNTSGNRLTLSFYVKSTRTGTHTVSLTTGYRAGTAYAQAAITLSYTINSANTWERKTISFDSYDTGGSAAWNTNNNIGVEIAFVAGQGTTGHGANSINSALDTWEDFSSSTFVYPKSTSDNNDWGTATTDRWWIAGVQLEVGNTATDFEHLDWATELRKCQRYYYSSVFANENSVAYNSAPIQLYHSYAKGAAQWEWSKATHPVTMRGAVGITTVDGNGNNGKISHWTSTGGGFTHNHTPYTAAARGGNVTVSEYSTGSIYGFYCNYLANAEL